MKTVSWKVTLAAMTIAFILQGTPARAQQTFITLHGILKDSKTGNVIAHAGITVPGTGIGTVSNTDGAFTLKIDTAVRADSFEVSHLSYATAKFRISDATGTGKTFFLEVRPIQLHEVAVSPVDARSLVGMALGRVGANYSRFPNMMTGFYRESVKQRRNFLSVSEAVVDIYKAPYKGFQNDQVRIFKGRKASYIKDADTLMVQLQGGPSVLLLLDIAKNPDLGIALSDLENYSFEIASVALFDDRLNWVITFSPDAITDYPLYTGKLYIRQDDLAITRAEFSLDLSDEEKAAGVFIAKKPAGLIFMPTSTKYQVNYIEQNNTHYLNYVMVELKFRCDWKRKLFRNNYTVVSEMAITGRRADSAARFPNQEVFRSNMFLNDKVQDLIDEDFWGEHNIIEPENSIETAIKKISKKLQK